MALPDSLIPKFNQTLTRASLANFICDLKFWASSRGVVNFNTLKPTLPLVIQNELAKQYLHIHREDLTNDKISFEAFVKDFIANCPMEAEEEWDNIIQLLSIRQPSNKKASHFVQKIRFLSGDKWEQTDEPEYVKHIVNNLDSAISRYIRCKGVPSTYTRLMAVIKEFEAVDPTADKNGQSKGSAADIFKQESNQSNATTLLLKSIATFNLDEEARYQRLQNSLSAVQTKLNELNVGENFYDEEEDVDPYSYVGDCNNLWEDCNMDGHYGCEEQNS